MNDSRIAFFTIFEKGLVPTQRYRLEAYTNKQNFTLQHKYFPVVMNGEVNDFYGDKISKKISLGIKLIYRRFCHLFYLRNYDVVFVSREALPIATYFFEFFVKKILKKKLVYDIDDAIWIKQVSDGNKKLSFLKSTKKISKIISLADIVIAGNSYLAEYALQFNKNVEIIPSCVDLDIYTLKPKSTKDNICIGWSGSESTLLHLLELTSVFQKIQLKYNNKVFIKVISSRQLFEIPGVNTKSVKWNAADEIEELREFDIGVMPLFNDEWSKGKCSMKGIQYMGLGIATIMTNIGANKVVIQNNKNGFLANTDQDWINILSILIEDELLRNKIGNEGYRTVEQNYSIQAWQKKWESLLTG